VFLKFEFGDGAQMYFVGAIDEAERAGSGPHSCKRVVCGEAASAMKLYCKVESFLSCSRDEDFAHSQGLDGRWGEFLIAGVELSGRSLHREKSTVDGDGGEGKALRVAA
jgi:hypothetical protein